MWKCIPWSNLHYSSIQTLLTWLVGIYQSQWHVYTSSSSWLQLVWQLQLTGEVHNLLGYGIATLHHMGLTLWGKRVVWEGGGPGKRGWREAWWRVGEGGEEEGRRQGRRARERNGVRVNATSSSPLRIISWWYYSRGEWWEVEVEKLVEAITGVPYHPLLFLRDSSIIVCTPIRTVMHNCKIQQTTHYLTIECKQLDIVLVMKLWYTIYNHIPHHIIIMVYRIIMWVAKKGKSRI